MHWLRDRNHDFYYAKTTPVAYYATQGDLILTPFDWVIADNIRHYTKAEVLSFAEINREFPKDEDAVTFLQKKLEQVLDDRHRVLFTKDAVDLSPLTIASLGDEIRLYKRVLDQYRSVWSVHGDAVGEFYAIESNLNGMSETSR